MVSKTARLGLAVGMVCTILTAGTYAQNLLVNPGFETGNLSGWTTWTVSPGLTTNKVSGTSDAFIYGPTPRAFGNYSYKAGEWSPSLHGTAGIYQQVPVVAGQLYSLAFKWAGGDVYPPGGTHEVGVTDGAVTNGNSGYLNRAIKQNVNAQFQWEAQQFTFTPTQSTVTVYVKTVHPGTGVDPIATWCDEFLLVQGAIVQHQLFSISPALVRGNASNTPNAKITGINLNGVDAVRMVKGGTTLNCTNLVIAGDGLSMTVTLPTAGAALGVYDIVAEKPGVSNATLPAAFTVRDPAAAILVNGDFEAAAGDSNATIPGWSRWQAEWGLTDGKSLTNRRVSGDTWIWTPKVNNVVTPAFGNYSFSCGEYNENGGEGGVLQQVPVVPGEMLLLRWKWGGGHNGVRGEYPGVPWPTHVAWEVGVVSGARHNVWLLDPDLGVLRWEDHQISYGFGWENRSITFTVPQGVDFVTVYCKLWYNPAEEEPPAPWTYVSLYWDDVVLSMPPNCGVQHTLTGVNPNFANANVSVVDLTVSGTNLNTVTSIRLARGLTQYWGQVLSQSPSAITARFTFPDSGGVLGKYDVITEQDGCLGGKLAQGFELKCINPTTLTGITPGTVTKPMGRTQMVVSGANVKDLAQVKLVFMPPPRQYARPTNPDLAGKDFPDPLNPGQYFPADAAPFWQLNTSEIREIIGTMLDASNPNAVVYEFNLSTAQVGTYKLVGRRNDVCGSPADVENALTVQLPPSGVNLLANGDFEAGNDAPWTIIPTPGNTDSSPGCGGAPIPGPAVVVTPPPLNGFNPHGGTRFMGTRAINQDCQNWVTPNGGSWEQSIGLPQGPGSYALTLNCWIRLFDQMSSGGDPGCSIKASIIVDDQEASTITARLTGGTGNMSLDGLDPYTPLSLDFVGQANTSIKVRFESAANAQWGIGAKPWLSIVAVDDIQLIGPPPLQCHTPFADADNDGDVDQDDFAIMQLCLTGPSGEIPTGGAYDCKCFDRDSDGFVTTSDVALFNVCGSGPMVPWAPSANCP